MEKSSETFGVRTYVLGVGVAVRTARILSVARIFNKKKCDVNRPYVRYYVQFFNCTCTYTGIITDYDLT